MFSLPPLLQPCLLNSSWFLHFWKHNYILRMNCSWFSALKTCTGVYINTLRTTRKKTSTSLIKICLVTIDMATRNRCICTLVAFLLSSILCDQQYVLWKSDVTVVRSWEKRDREEEELLERQREGTSRAVWLRCLIQVAPRFNQCSCG